MSRTKVDTTDAGNRQYTIWKEEHQAGTIFQVAYKCYRGEGLHNLGGIRSLRPKVACIVRTTHGTVEGFGTYSQAEDAMLNHSKVPYRGSHLSFRGKARSTRGTR